MKDTATQINITFKIPDDYYGTYENALNDFLNSFPTKDIEVIEKNLNSEYDFDEE